MTVFEKWVHCKNWENLHRKDGSKRSVAIINQKDGGKKLVILFNSCVLMGWEVKMEGLCSYFVKSKE